VSDRVQDVKTADTRRDITALLNAHSRRPILLAALCIGESNLKEHAWRNGGGCDISGGLVQQSVCYPPKGIPGFTYPPPGQKAAPSAENLAALKAWSWDAANVLADAGPRLDGLYDVAAAVLGPSDPRVPLAALCLWNAPNLGGGTTRQAVPEWMAENLPRMDPEHAANRENYRRALAAAEQYRVQEAPMPDPITDPTEAIRQLQAQQSLQSEAIAAILTNHYQDGPQSAKGLLVQLDPNKYGNLAVVEMQPKT
jgi:hypothetical protein